MKVKYSKEQRLSKAAFRRRMVRYVKKNPLCSDKVLREKITKMMYLDYPCLIQLAWPEFWIRDIKKRVPVGKYVRGGQDPFEHRALKWLQKQSRTSVEVHRFWRKETGSFPTRAMLYLFRKRNKIVVEDTEQKAKVWMFTC